MLDERLLKILVCPQCKGKIEFDKRNEIIVCELCRLKFPVKKDVPIMLVDYAEKY